MQQIAGHPQRFKRQLRRRLFQAHVARGRADLESLCQWHCYRTLEALRQPCSWVLPWNCSICAKSFRTKAALRVHLFKCHNRGAPHRRVAQGTRCAACHREYWTEGCLLRHLRDSPACVGHLQSSGHEITTVALGVGSRERRRQDSLQYTLAPPWQAKDRSGLVAGPQWQKEQRDAYRELCTLLFEPTSPVSAQAVCEVIKSTVQRYPLYPGKTLEILDLLAEETTFLQEAHQSRPWDEQVYAWIQQALERSKEALWEQRASHKEDPEKSQHFSAFQAVHREQITAPAKFWQQPLSAPFWHTCRPMQPN